MTIVRSESKPLAPTEMPGLDACEALNAEAGSGALTAGAFVLRPIQRIAAAPPPRGGRLLRGPTEREH